MAIVVAFLLILGPSYLLACSKGCVGGECGTCTGKTEYGEDFEKDPKTLSSAAITTASLIALIKSKVPLTILDCRSGGCVDGKVIPGAKGFTDKTTDEEVKTLLPSKDLLIITYDGNPKCCARAEVSERLKKLGYSNLVDYPPGIRGWIAAGNQPEVIPVPAKKVN